jgi:two-component system chemotaxis sensor kinase CheA
MKDQKKYFELFIEEANEQLQNLNQSLLVLESNKQDQDSVNEAFRLIHTVKGTANILGLNNIGDLAHSMEDLLDDIRVKKIEFNQEIMDILFEGIDILSEMVAELAEKGEVKTDAAGFIENIREINNSFNTDQDSDDSFESLDIILDNAQKKSFTDAKDKGSNLFLVNITISDDCKLKEGRIFQVLKDLKSLGTVIASAPDTNNVQEDQNKIQVLLATSADKKEVKVKVKNVSEIKDVMIEMIDSLADLESGKKNDDKKPGGKRAFSSSETVRVKSSYLDSLLDLVGELMISEIRVKQIASDINHKGLKQVLKNNDRLIGEIQDQILRMRMVPIDHIFKRFPRMVRDIAKEMEKNIEFKIEGNDIEIDRSLLDDVGDVVMHLLRNSIDHGIEPIEERTKSSKKPEGSLLLKAFREQSNVVIDVVDDGRGIDLDKLASSAISKGLISREDVNKLDERGKVDLALLPGLTTAEVISDVSGRGVGLDVVNDKIKGLGGTIKIDTAPEKGTEVIVKLPPSMAIIRAMLIEVDSDKYAIPLENVVETVKIIDNEIHNVLNTGIFKLREEVLPIMDLHTEFGGNGTDQELISQMPVVIVEKNGNRAGLIVSKLLGQQEIVIKNLSTRIRNLDHFSGATILGDGKVTMIIDVGAFFG